HWDVRGGVPCIRLETELLVPPASFGIDDQSSRLYEVLADLHGGRQKPTRVVTQIENQTPDLVVGRAMRVQRRPKVGRGLFAELPDLDPDDSFAQALRLNGPYPDGLTRQVDLLRRCPPFTR